MGADSPIRVRLKRTTARVIALSIRSWLTRAKALLVTIEARLRGWVSRNSAVPACSSLARELLARMAA